MKWAKRTGAAIAAALILVGFPLLTYIFAGGVLTPWDWLGVTLVVDVITLFLIAGFGMMDIR